MHPIIAQQFAEATQRDRLARAAQSRLAREALEQRRAVQAGDRRPTLAARRPRVLAVLRFLGA